MDSEAAGVPADGSGERIVVRGRVQGVGFRWMAARLARSFGLAGTVRNRADGAVEIHAWGDPESRNRFRAALGRDTPGRVDEVRTSALTPAERREVHGFADDFRIVS